MRQAPQRTCVGCRKARAKGELLRLARTPSGVRFDPDQQLEGRGAYVCPDPECVRAAARREGHPVRRALRGGRTDEVEVALEHARRSASSRRQTPETRHREEHNA